MSNNLYGTLRTTDPADVAHRLAGAGWESRKSGWHEHELTTSWCTFVLVRVDDELNLSGAVADGRVDDVAAALTGLGVAFSLELYDDEQRLLREVSG